MAGGRQNRAYVWHAPKPKIRTERFIRLKWMYPRAPNHVTPTSRQDARDTHVSDAGETPAVRRRGGMMELLMPHAETGRAGTMPAAKWRDLAAAPLCETSVVPGDVII